MGKREYASLVPYRKRADAYEYFMQKRDMSAALNPGLYGLFGGSIEEGETSEQGMLREIREELGHVPQAHRFFSRYELHRSVLHVFIEEVGPDFESSVNVQEGEYGKFMTPAELIQSTIVSQISELAIVEIDRMLRG